MHWFIEKYACANYCEMKPGSTFICVYTALKQLSHPRQTRANPPLLQSPFKMGQTWGETWLVLFI